MEEQEHHGYSPLSNNSNADNESVLKYVKIIIFKILDSNTDTNNILPQYH